MIASLSLSRLLPTARSASNATARPASPGEFVLRLLPDACLVLPVPWLLRLHPSSCRIGRHSACFRTSRATSGLGPAQSMIG
jgi:hypothetical protein